MSRQSGILLPLASLPSSFGIGDFGPSAYQWVDWMRSAGQSIWSILPLLIPDHVGSPFTPQSAFAGNWMLISPELLQRKGLLRRVPLAKWRTEKPHINYKRSNIIKRELIGLAWLQFQHHASQKDQRSFARFKRQEHAWLDDYCTFMAIKDRQGGAPWWTWPLPLRHRSNKELRIWQREYATEIEYFAFGQWLFAEQWNALHAYATGKGVQILGDIPYYVAHDSVDVWVNSHLFHLDRYGIPHTVSGAPPDRLRRNGQLWGDPLYNWKTMEATAFKWWVARFKHSTHLYDAVRLDHFRGYVAVWGVPAGKSPRKGKWHTVPGEKLFHAIQNVLQHFQVIAEDLGSITNEVYALRDRFGFSGSIIAQWLFQHSPLLPSVQKQSVIYSETHDMPTLKEWYTILTPRKRSQILQHLHATSHTMVWRGIEEISQSTSNIAIFPMQDVLGLGKSARLNIPGKTKGNWQWRMSEKDLRLSTARRLKEVTIRGNRE